MRVWLRFARFVAYSPVFWAILTIEAKNLVNKRHGTQEDDTDKQRHTGIFIKVHADQYTNQKAIVK